MLYHKFIYVQPLNQLMAHLYIWYLALFYMSSIYLIQVIFQLTMNLYLQLI